MRIRSLIVVLVTSTVVSGVLAGVNAAPSIVSVNCATQSLQTAINGATAGATLAVSGTCVGQFTVSKSLTIEGKPKATLDGNLAGTTLLITGSPTVRLQSVTIERGIAADGGGIAALDGATVTLDQVTVTGNKASDDNDAEGGGMDMQGNGQLTITDSTFTKNSAVANGGSGQIAEGGGLWYAASAVITDSMFTDNTVSSTAADGDATGQAGGLGGMGNVTMTSTTASNNSVAVRSDDNSRAQGGGLYVGGLGSRVKISGSTFNDNALTSDGENLAAVNGGGAYLVPESTIATRISSSVFADNSAVAAASIGDISAAGGGLWFGGLEVVVHHIQVLGSKVRASAPDAGPVMGAGMFLDGFGVGEVTDSAFIGNQSVLHSADSTGATDVGGGAYIAGDLGAFDIARSTFASNRVLAASSQGGATVAGGGLEMSGGPGGVAISASTISGNRVEVTGAATAARASGAGLDLTKTGSNLKSMTDSTIANNEAVAVGTQSAAARGGGIKTTPRLTLRYDTIAANSTTATGPGSDVSAGGGVSNATGSRARRPSVVGTILTSNTAAAHANCAGGLTSAGYNLFGALAGCAVTLKPSDHRGAADLGNLAANGGPTKTMALGPRSLALDRVPKAVCLKVVKRDQRGVKRPQGSRCDEGAYEKKI
jgi:hypothetical protein